MIYRTPQPSLPTYTKYDCQQININGKVRTRNTSGETQCLYNGWGLAKTLTEGEWLKVEVRN